MTLNNGNNEIVVTEQGLKDVIDRLETMHQFSVNFIPEPPVLDKDLYDKYVIPNFIRCGAIPKDKLTVGKTYYGNCRNADRAIWTGDCFEYQRTKFGSTYIEKIKHFEDGGGSSTDVFVPFKEL